MHVVMHKGDNGGIESMLPSKKQWKHWSLPSKYTVLSFLIGFFFGVLGTGLSVYFWLNPRSPVEPIALPPAIFRSTPIPNLLAEDAKAMIQKNGFFDSGMSNTPWANAEAKGFDNRFEIKEGGLIVVDYASGLIWQRNGSNAPMTFIDAHKYISSLNQTNFAGHSNWRLPTLEEAMSLMEPQPTGLPPMHIDSVFNLQLWCLWTCDKYDDDQIWLVHFPRGECEPTKDGLVGWVRAVR